MSPDEYFRLIAISSVVVLLSSAAAYWLTRTFVPICVGLVHFLVQIVIFLNWGIVGRDAEFYHETALRIAESFGKNEAAVVRLTDGKEGWPYLLGTLYHLAVPSPVIGLLLNSCFVAIAISLVLAIAFAISDQPPRQYYRSVAVAVVLFPSLWIWSVSLLKEPVFWVCVLSMVFAAIRIISNGYSAAMFGLLVLGAFGGSFVRASVTYVLLAVCLAFLVVARSQGDSAASRKRSGFVTVVASAGLLAAAVPAISYFSGSKYLDDEALGATRDSLSSAGSGFSNTGLSDLPTVFLRVVFGPFPWELARMSPVYAIDWVVWIVVLVGAFLALPRWRKVFLIPVAAFFVLLSLAFVTANYGTLIRIRTVAGFILLPLAVMGFARIRKIKHGRTTSWQ